MSKTLLSKWILIILSIIFVNVSVISTAHAIILEPCSRVPRPSFCDPTPTPEPTEPNPIILVPGITASFNPTITLADVDSSQWDFAPGARPFYQGLLDRLAQQGFVENENLFIAHYDWRKPVANSASNYLKPLVDQVKQATGASKVDVVAHSMGGLVARSYIQGNQYENDVDQLIMLGTPNLGAADAYVAWEGGILPGNWNAGIKFYIFSVENSLRVARAEALLRPLSLRSFFPSLRDLLPIESYIVRNDVPLQISDMVEQNAFLQNLHARHNSLTERGVQVTTIAGSNIQTLNQVPIISERSIFDILRFRWRDGQANPNPPQADALQGDQRVLLTSAHLGTDKITLPNSQHDNLPEDAQGKVLTTLGLDTGGDHIHYDKPGKFLGTLILSPVIPTITTPDGKSFTCAQTKEEDNAACVTDETDLDGPKLLVLVDPLPGEYKLTLTGTGIGNYHAITCFADDDESLCSTREGTIRPGQVETYSLDISENSIILPAEDIATLLQELRDSMRNLSKDKHIKDRAFGKLWGVVTRMQSFGKSYERLSEQYGLNDPRTKRFYEKIEQDYSQFIQELEEHAKADHIDETAVLELSGIMQSLEDSGL